MIERSADHLYKVSASREDLAFTPSVFWRTDDWSFSDDRPHPGLIEDAVLFAGEFDFVNLHLLPNVWRARVWLDDEGRVERLTQLGQRFDPSSVAAIFVAETDRAEVEAFRPTVFMFDRSGFVRTPTDEFVARDPQVAIAHETMTFAEARRRWQIEVAYVVDPAELEASLQTNGIDHQIQSP